MIGARAGVPKQYLQAGAGRSVDWMWPDPGTMTTSGAGASQQGRTRGGTAISFATSGSNKSFFSADGRYIAQLQLPSITPAAFLMSAVIGRVVPAWKPAPFLAVPGPFGVRRIMATLQANGVGMLDNDVTGDIGLQLCAGNVSQMIGGGAGRFGIGIQLSAAKAAQLVTRSVDGVLHRATITSDPFDRAETHTYELRIFEATAAAYGRLEVWIDGVQAPIPAAMSSWAPGTQLPAMTSAGPESALGFQCWIVNGQAVGSGITLDVSQVRYMAGETLNDVL